MGELTAAPAVFVRNRKRVLFEAGLPLLVIVIFTNASDILIRVAHIPSSLQILIGVLAIAVWFRRMQLRPARAVTTLTTILLLLFLLVLFTSTAWARDLGLADARVSDAAKGFAIYLLVTVLASTWSALRRAVVALIAAGVFLSLLSIMQLMTGRSDADFLGFSTMQSGTIYSEVAGARVAGPLHDPNFYAQILLIALPLAVVTALGARTPLRRALAIASALITGTVVMLTYSRGAMLALGAMTVMLALSIHVRIRHIATAGAFGIVMLFLLPANVTARLGTVELLLPSRESKLIEQDASIEKRKLVLATALAEFRDHPWLGVGVANFSEYYSRYSNVAGSSAPQYDEPGIVQFPHTLYAQLAAENGIVGLAIFVAAMAAAFRSLQRSRVILETLGTRRQAMLASGVMVALAGYLMTSAFLHGAYLRYLWLLLGFAAAIQRLRTQPDSHVEVRA
jgi:O-antigen ligase